MRVVSAKRALRAKPLRAVQLKTAEGERSLPHAPFLTRIFSGWQGSALSGVRVFIASKREAGNSTFLTAGEGSIRLLPKQVCKQKNFSHSNEDRQEEPMLRSLTVSLARSMPTSLKKWVHHHRFVDRVARKTFSGILGAEGNVVNIQRGPLAGLSLAVSEHISHAHVAGTYELETLRAIDRLVSPGSICYDLGASIGYISLLMARKAKRVYAFEPAPHAMEEIRKHAAVNQFENIEIVPSPVSDCARTVEFSLTDNAYGSCIVNSEVEWPTLKLTTITLDHFTLTHPFPDVIKVDVEGEEGRVFEGARSILRKKKASICCELHSAEAARQVQEILSEYDYRITTLDGEPFRLSGPIIAGELQILATPQ